MTAQGGFLIAAALSFIFAFAAANCPPRYSDTMAVMGVLSFTAAAFLMALAGAIVFF